MPFLLNEVTEIPPLWKFNWNHPWNINICLANFVFPGENCLCLLSTSMWVCVSVIQCPIFCHFRFFYTVTWLKCSQLHTLSSIHLPYTYLTHAESKPLTHICNAYEKKSLDWKYCGNHFADFVALDEEGKKSVWLKIAAHKNEWVCKRKFWNGAFVSQHVKIFYYHPSSNGYLWVLFCFPLALSLYGWCCLGYCIVLYYCCWC